MEKYLFTDGTNAVREVSSKEELRSLIETAAQQEKIRIWIFDTSEWLPFAAFVKRFPGFQAKTNPSAAVVTLPPPIRKSAGKSWLKKFLFFILFLGAIFLVYNFTRVRWVKGQPFSITATRPANTPVMDVDSLLTFLEESRGQKLDKVTRTNLRIRNTWPERIGLQLNAGHDSSSSGFRYYNMALTIDNTTGYNLDNAVVKVTVWKNHEVNASDTFHFTNISYAVPAKRDIPSTFKGDSISVAFQSIKGKVFNFCYSAEKKSNYGNNNDRWFCRE